MASFKTTTGVKLGEGTYESVRNYYGKVLSSSKDLKTSACTTSNKPSPSVLNAMRKIPSPVMEKFYGCGTPLPTSIEGLHVLDLGCGSGRDCYLASALVGEHGSVTGLDMTAEQLGTARDNVEKFTATLGYAKPNMRFLEGMIEFVKDAGVAPGSIDLVISNCVINLSPDKEAVIRGCWEALREGGELFFSDVYCDRRLPQATREHDVMLGECLGGALYIEDFKRLCHKTGFWDPRELSREEIIVSDPELKGICKGARFYSITYRCFKVLPTKAMSLVFSPVPPLLLTLLFWVVAYSRKVPLVGLIYRIIRKCSLSPLKRLDTDWNVGDAVRGLRTSGVLRRDHCGPPDFLPTR